MTRLFGWLAGVVREPHTQSDPHFHAGPAHRPAACFDPRCGRPHLDI